MLQISKASSNSLQCSLSYIAVFRSASLEYIVTESRSIRCYLLSRDTRTSPENLGWTPLKAWTRKGFTITLLFFVQTPKRALCLRFGDLAFWLRTWSRTAEHIADTLFQKWDQYLVGERDFILCSHSVSSSYFNSLEEALHV